MKKISVIMSTYNGQQYLEEQIRSIFAQSGVEVRLFIRDDGSKDETIEIIQKLQKEFPIELVEGGKNLKPAASFLEALKLCNWQSDYFSFADQDDVWFPDKLSRASKLLDPYSEDLPTLYSSTYDVVDKNLSLLFLRNLEIYGKINMQKTLMGVSPSGCTMVFNNLTKTAIVKSNPKSMRMHDFWTLLTVEALNGKIFVDNTPTMKYRQHNENSVGYTKKFGLNQWIRLLKDAKTGNKRYSQAVSVLENYEERMAPNLADELRKLINYKKGVSYKIALLKDKTYKTGVLRINLLFKISIILGLF